MKNYNAKNVDAYIASADREARPKLKEIRAIVQSTVPKAEEGISWGIPIYKYHGLLIGFAALKNHVDVGLTFALQDEDRAALEKRGYKTGKKTVQIKFDQRVPVVMIRRIVKARAKENEGAHKK